MADDFCKRKLLVDMLEPVHEPREGLAPAGNSAVTSRLWCMIALILGLAEP